MVYGKYQPYDWNMIQCQEDKMNTRDDWGNDPTVQMMRRIFSLMEKAQGEVMDRLGISPFNPKIRRVRSCSRDFFEETWPLAMQRGIISNDQETILLYLCCLRRALKLNGFRIPDHRFSDNERIEQFLKETLR